MRITKQIGQRVQEFRAAAGMTQDELAEALKLPRTAIVQMEAGNRPISTLELEVIANRFSVPILRFFEETVEEDPLISILRAAGDLEENDQWKVEITKYLNIFRAGIELRNCLGKPKDSGPPQYEQPIPSRVMEAVDQGVSVAAQERQRIGLGDSPIPDMSDLINSQGIWATGAKMPDAMSGVYLNHSTIGQAILVNYDHPRERKRFSYAHEYAHALLDRALRATVTVNSRRSDLHEVRANAFAAGFLMPAGGVKLFLESRGKTAPRVESHPLYDIAVDHDNEELKEDTIRGNRRNTRGAQEITFEDVVSTAVHFGVSYVAMCFRLKSLSLITEQDLEGLRSKEEQATSLIQAFQEFQSTVDNPESKKKPDREIVMQVVHLAIEARRLNEITEAKLKEVAKLIGISASLLVLVAKST